MSLPAAPGRPPAEPPEPGAPTSSQATSPPSRPRAGRLLAIIGLAVVLAIAAIGLSALVNGPPPATPEPGASSEPTASSPASGGSPSVAESPSPSATLPPLARDGFLVNRSDLADRARRGRAGEEPYATALANLLDWAEDAVGSEPDPQQVIDIPGTEGPFVDDTATAYGLGLAWVATDDVRYAERAADFIRAWTTTTERTANTCPDGGECQTSLIIGRVGAGLVFAADLIGPSGALSTSDEDDFRAWLREVILPAASERPNNWGDAGNFMRLVVADYLGDGNSVAATLDRWRSFMDLVEADGHIPEEVRRGRSGIQYTQEALMYKVAAARIAERRGVDLWSYHGSFGADLRTAMDHLARYWDDPDAWPWNERAPRVPAPAPMWEIAFEHYGEPAWPALFAAERPFGSDGHSAVRWTTLTNGVPLVAAN